MDPIDLSENAALDDAPFVFACASADLREGMSICVVIAETSVLVCRAGGQVYAVENRCSHMAKPLLGGRVIGTRVTCPAHGAAFDLKSGKALTYPGVTPIRVFAVREEDGEVTVQAPARSA